MSEIRVEDPDLYTKKDVDNSGRVYLGKEWAGREVKIVVELVDDDECDNAEEVVQ